MRCISSRAVRTNEVKFNTFPQTDTHATTSIPEGTRGVLPADLQMPQVKHASNEEMEKKLLRRVKHVGIRSACVDADSGYLKQGEYRAC